MSSLVLPRRPKAVVFDLDGTLIDSEQFVLGGYMAAATRLDIAFTHDHFLSLVGRHRKHSEMKMLEYFGETFPLETFYGHVAEHLGDNHAPLKAGVIALADHLDAAAIPFGLATSSGPAWVERHFKAHDLAHRFRCVVTREDVVNGKPHPEPYLKAARLLGFEPADMLAVEDSPTGVRSAAAAGMMTVMAPDLIQPDDEVRALTLAVVNSLDEITASLR